jgi:hypothetical protein
MSQSQNQKWRVLRICPVNAGEIAVHPAFGKKGKKTTPKYDDLR